ncbi:MAG: META domain-containing protein [Thermoanaerobaculia bacterium]|nr:META domain-containing protein [Thermoanaerobaculia bacterium]
MRSMIIRPFVVALAAVVVACAPSEEGGSEPVASEAEPAQAAAPSTEALLDAEWRLVSMGEGGETSPVLEEAEVTLAFGDDGRASGSGGCNRYTAGYEADGGGSLSFSPAAATMMACPVAAVADQEAAFFAALDGVETWAVDGDELRLGGAGVELRFEPRPTPSLERTRWSVVGVNNGRGGVASVVAGSELTAVFEEGAVSGSAGCNSYNASYELDGERLSVGPAAATRKMCGRPEGVMEQESAFLAALQTVASWGFEGDLLRLRTSEGATAVTLRAD